MRCGTFVSVRYSLPVDRAAIHLGNLNFLLIVFVCRLFKEIDMNALKFLEQMAKCVHHHTGLNDLVDSQPSEVAIAYQTNNSDLLKKYFGDIECIANPSDVVQF
jgi:hypothetical protein